MTAAPTEVSITELSALEREELVKSLGSDRLAGSEALTSFVFSFRGSSARQIEAVLAAFAVTADMQSVDQSDAFTRLISAMTPPHTAGRGVTLQAQRNAEARAALQDEFGLLTSAETARAAGARAKNTSSLASRWRKDRRVFAVPGSDGARLYPGFQFDYSGQPLPVIALIISAFGSALDGWSLALWFVGSNGWLGGERPVDVLDDDQVIVAAQQLAAEIR